MTVPKDYLLCDSISSHFWPEKNNIDKENKLVADNGWGRCSSLEESGCGYKKTGWGTIIIIEVFCILTINVHILVVIFTIVLQMLPLEETGWRVYCISPHYFLQVLVNLHLSQNNVIFLKINICLTFSKEPD